MTIYMLSMENDYVFLPLSFYAYEPTAEEVVRALWECGDKWRYLPKVKP